MPTKLRIILVFSILEQALRSHSLPTPEAARESFTWIIPCLIRLMRGIKYGSCNRKTNFGVSQRAARIIRMRLIGHLVFLGLTTYPTFDMELILSQVSLLVYGDRG